MKKTLLMLTVLVLAVPAMAAVSIDVNDLGDGWVAIEYSADSNVSAFGLKVTVDGANTITDLNSTSYHIGESNSTAKGYGIFLGKIVIDSGGNVTSYGNPIAPNTDPGASGTGLDTNTVILELGALYEDGNQPPLSGTLCILRVSGCTTMSVVGEATRCGEVSEVAAGAVLEGGSTSVVIDDSNATNVAIDYLCGCACYGDIAGTEGPDPDGVVSTSDMSKLLTELLGAGAPYSIDPVPEGFECMDLAGTEGPAPDNVLSTSDMSALLTYLLGLGAPYSGDCMDDPNP